MKQVWKIFWKTLAAILNTVRNLAEAGEVYSETIKDSANIDRAKAQAKLAKAKRKLEQAEA